MLGEESAKTIGSMMAAQRHGTSVITTFVGIVALLFGASGVFGQLQDSLNTIWEVQSQTRRRVLGIYPGAVPVALHGGSATGVFAAGCPWR